MATLKVEKHLECSICLEKYTNPKQLRCHHHFCKECLDEILKFNDDGSGVINCPMRCSKQTVIPDNQTTNDLGASFEIKGILETLRQDEQSLDVQLCNTKRCKKDVVVYCCGLIMCKQCGSNHQQSKEYHEGETDVLFDKKNETLKVLCKEHISSCTHLCSDNNFLCIYCLNRKHKTHPKDKIGNQATKIREALKNDLKNMENVPELLKVTEESIAVSKKKLADSLRERKIACLARYLDFLNKEEEAIRTQFKEKSYHHINQYPFPNDAQYYTEKLRKDDIGLTIEKHSIISNISRSNLQSVSVSLSENFHFLNEHPMGDLEVTFVDDIPLCDFDPSTPTFKDHFSQLNDYEHILSTYLKKVNLLQEADVREDGDSCSKEGTTVINYVSESKSNSLKDKRPRPTPRPKPKAKPKQETDEPIPKPKQETDERDKKPNKMLNECIKLLEVDGIKYIEELIKGNKTEKLKVLLQARPDIVKMCDYRSRTPFIQAAHESNIELMKMFVAYGGSVMIKDNLGATVLHFAVVSENESVVRWLSENHPILLNEKDDDGDSPLHCAAYHGCLTSLNLLLDYEADIHMKNNTGVTPLGYAKSCGRRKCVEELKARLEGNTYVNIQRR